MTVRWKAGVSIDREFRLLGKGPTLREGDTYSLVDPGSSRKRPIEAIEGQINCFGVPYSSGVDLPGKFS